MKITGVSEEIIREMTPLIRRDQFSLGEYTTIGEDRLRAQFVSDRLGMLDRDGFLSFAAEEDGRLAGIISCHRDAFDSNIFGFACYRIIDLIVLDENRHFILNVTGGLIDALLKEIRKLHPEAYLLGSLNNNVKGVETLFNLMMSKGFGYIHTLLTFTQPAGTGHKVVEPTGSSRLIIREAGPGDAERVGEIAGSSFKFSRFHLDSLLYNSKADELIRLSARNCILEKYADIVYVAEVDGKIAGYYTGRKKYYGELGISLGEIVTLATCSEYRSMGVFRALDTRVLNWFGENTTIAELGTYLGNMPVHRVWAGRGLTIIRGTHLLSRMV